MDCALLSDEVKKAFQTQGMDPSSTSPAEFQRLVEQDAKRWALGAADQGAKHFC